VAGILVTLACAALYWLFPSVTMRIDYSVLPFQMSMWLNRPKASGAVVIVAVDDETVDAYTRSPTPISALYPALFRKLKDDKAAIVGLSTVLPRDLGLTDPVLSKLLGRSRLAASDVNESDWVELERDLAEAIEDQGSTYLGWTSEGSALAPPDYLSPPRALLSVQNRQDASSPPHFGPIRPREVKGSPAHYAFGRGDDIVDSNGRHEHDYPPRYEGPSQLLNRAARGTAYLDLEVGGGSGVTQYVAPVLNIAGDYYAPFSEAIAADYLHTTPIAIAFTDWTASVSIGSRMIPPGWFLYCRSRDAFARYSAIDVVNGKTPNQDLAGKIVLVGFETQASPKSQSLGGSQYLVELQANAIEDILSDNFIRVLTDDSIVYGMAGIIGLGITLFLAYYATSMTDRRLIIWSIITVLTFFFVYYGFAVYFLRAYGLYFTWLAPLSFGGLAQTVAFSTLLRRRRQIRERLRTAFEHYLDPTIIETVVNDPAGLRLGGSKRHLSVLFADIVNFTAKAEAMSPESLIEMLNIFMSAMTEVVITNGGVVDKIVGDSIMAFWGAPALIENPARSAVNCGLEMLDELKRLRGLDARFADLYMGVGVSTGDAVVGNLGGKRRFDYSVVGDTVNLAARLESLTRQLGVSFLVNKQTFNETAGAYVARPLGLVRVKGKTNAVEVVQIVGTRADAVDLSYYEMFSEALNKLRNSSAASEGIQQLQRLANLRPDDVPIKLYLELMSSHGLGSGDELVLEFASK